MPGDAEPRRRAPLASGLSLACFFGCAALVLVAVMRPVATDDAWFHLAMGETYLSEGLWPAEDPMLFTAGDRAPVQHEWGFGVALRLLERAVGLQGLRVVHGIAVALLLLWVFAWLRRQSGAALPAALASCAFLVLAWRRLIQLRPDLFSISAALAVPVLLFAVARGPSWPRCLAVAGLFAVWANVHSLFAAGLCLGLAGGFGLVCERLLAARLPEPAAAPPRPAPGRVFAALGLGGVAALLNPRGIEQHLTFLSSTRDAAIWAVKDEWARFDPFHPPDAQTAGLDPLAWVTANVLLAGFVVLAVARGVALLRRPDAARLAAFDPVGAALAAAGLVAMLVSVRFLWMGFFALAYGMHAWRSASLAASRGLGALAAGTAAGSLALSAAFVSLDDWRSFAWEVEREPGGYRASHLSRRYLDPAIDFLEAAGLEGRLFNPYHVGGYAGRRLAPKLRTFIDGRTEHYPPEVMDDYLKVVSVGNRSDVEPALRVLDGWEVDVFLGVGLPEGFYGDLFTVDMLKGEKDWVPIFRSSDHSLFLRRHPRNALNLWRVQEYYGARGIRLDPALGFVPSDVIRVAPEWSVAHGLIPEDFERWAAQRRDPDPEVRFRALDGIARVFLELGEGALQIDADLEALEIHPEAREPRRRLVNTYLRQGRLGIAERMARELYDSDRNDERARRLYEFTLRQRHAL